MLAFLLLLAVCSSIEVYIVPHSHCDPGWIETVKWYYDRQARSILNNIVVILQKDPRRKIVWSETSFLKIWMEEITDTKKDLFRQFVKNGQIEFVGGGFVQNDEANPDFEMVIRQLETGHQYLNQEFGINRVKVGWQIDPFGHSALTPSLWSKFGYEYLVTNRINVLMRDELVREGNIEFVWEGVNFGFNESIFTHNLYDHYDPPPMLHPYKNHCFTKNNLSDELLSRCMKLLNELAKTRRSAYKHDKLMLLYGDDFYYMNSDEGEKLYQRIEALRDYAERSKEYPGLTIKIATASEYFEAVKSANPKLSVYKGDLLPYINFRAGREPAHWTGYYTTRPHLKQTIYYTHKLVRATEIVLALSKGASFFAGESSLALHHDAITGTCRPQVVEDYTERCIAEQKKAITAINDAIQDRFSSAEHNFELAIPYRVLVVYNPLNWAKTNLFSLEADENVFVQIKNWQGEYVVSQSVKSILGNKKTVYAKLEVPALSFVTLFINEYTESCEHCDKISEQQENGKTISDKHFTISLNDFGMVQNIKKSNKKYDLKQTFWTYYGSKGGAYIFHPTSNGNEINDLSLDKIMVSKGHLLETVEVIWRRERKTWDADYYYQKIVLYGESRFIWKFGIFATNNEEILVRFSSDNISGDKWLLTSNSGDLRERKYFQETATKKGSNMYPVPGGFAVEMGKEYLKIFPKFSIGVAMVDNSSFELLLHRHLGQDDNFGLAYGVDDYMFLHYHFEVELGELTHRSYWKSYLEAKADIYSFPLTNFDDFLISGDDWSNAVQVNQTWDKETVYSLGFSHSDIYLSSAVIKNSQLVMRIMNLKDAEQSLSVKGFQFTKKKLFDGFLDASSVKVSWKRGKEFMYSQRPDSSLPKYLPSSDLGSKVGKVLLHPFEFSAFNVKIVPAGEEQEEGGEEEMIKETETETETEQNIPLVTDKPGVSQASTDDIQRLEYAVVFSLCGIALISIILHFRSKGKRKGID